MGNWEDMAASFAKSYLLSGRFPCTLQHTPENGYSSSHPSYLPRCTWGMLHNPISNCNSLFNEVWGKSEQGENVHKTPKRPRAGFDCALYPLWEPLLHHAELNCAREWVFMCAPGVIKKNNPDANFELYSLWALGIKQPSSPSLLQGTQAFCLWRTDSLLSLHVTLLSSLPPIVF